jgi:hypothetical protein
VMGDMIDIRLVGDWQLADKILSVSSTQMQVAADMAIGQEAEFYVGKIKQYMRSGSFAPLSPNTLAVAGGKSGGKPLFRSGDLRNAVTSVTTGDGTFIGVPRGAPGGAGKPMVNIARVHEEGATIVMRMTPAMRRFLHARLPKRIGPSLPSGKFNSSSTGIIVIKIPARPFIQPIYDKFGPGTEKRFVARLVKILAAMGAPLEAGATGAGKGPPDRSAAAYKGWATRRAKAAGGGA